MKLILLASIIFLSNFCFSETIYINKQSANFKLSFRDFISSDLNKIQDISFSETTIKGLCIGGDLCGKSDILMINFSDKIENFFGISLYERPKEVFISKVRVYAHDKIGGVHKAHLILRVRNEISNYWSNIYERDVKKVGSWLEFPINQKISALEFSSVNEDWEQKGDETMILEVESQTNEF